MSRKSVSKDIMMICKGHYDKEKHKNLEDALHAYYRREYGVSEVDLPSLSYEFIVCLWLKGCVREFLNDSNKYEFWHYVISEESLHEKDFCGKNVFGGTPATNFYEVLYHRLVRWLQLMEVVDDNGNELMDVSEYQGNVI